MYIVKNQDGLEVKNVDAHTKNIINILRNNKNDLKIEYKYSGELIVSYKNISKSLDTSLPNIQKLINGIKSLDEIKYIVVGKMIVNIQPWYFEVTVDKFVYNFDYRGRFGHVTINK